MINCSDKRQATSNSRAENLAVACRMLHVASIGFTLVELIVVSALLLIVGGGLLTTFLTGQTSYLSADAYVQVQQEARRAFDNMVRELREAGAEAGQSITETNVTATNSQLNFQIARGYNNEAGCMTPPAICWGSDNATGTGEWVHYTTLSPGTGNTAQLIRWRDTTPTPGAPGSCTAPECRVLANHVRSLDFTLSGTPTEVISVTLQIQYNSPLLPSGSQTTPALTSQVQLRN